MDHPKQFLTTPMAVLIGSAIVSFSILISGGIINIGKISPSSPPSQAVAEPQQPQAAKTEADMVNSLKSIAAKIGLDQGKFNSCLDSGQKAPMVQADLDEGSAAGVNGTPAFFINGRLISGAVPFDQFKKVIDEELSGSAPANTERKTVNVGNLPALGNANAKVTIVEFSDYQCPFCERFFTQTEGQIKKEYVDTGKVKFYYRDFPLTQIHPGAQKGAEAARCAGDQNKYWEFHDAVFQNQASIF